MKLQNEMTVVTKLIRRVRFRHSKFEIFLKLAINDLN